MSFLFSIRSKTFDNLANCDFKSDGIDALIRAGTASNAFLCALANDCKALIFVSKSRNLLLIVNLGSSLAFATIKIKIRNIKIN